MKFHPIIVLVLLYITAACCCRLLGCCSIVCCCWAGLKLKSVPVDCVGCFFFFPFLSLVVIQLGGVT